MPNRGYLAQPGRSGSAGLGLSVLVATIIFLANAGPAHAFDCNFSWHPNPAQSNLDGPVFATTSWDPDGAGPLSPMLVVGGSFSTVGSTSTSNVAAWDGKAWHSLGSGTNNRVLALTVYNNSLIAGGDFTTAGGGSRPRIARWDGSAWQPLGAGMNGIVAALTVYNGNLIAAGLFTLAGGTSVQNIAQWNGSAWQPVGGGLGGSFPYVQTVCVYGTRLIAGGNFITAGGAPANYIAQWDGSSWQALGSGISGFGYISALTTYNGKLAVGGQFPHISIPNAHNFAFWDGSNWQGIGEGFNAAISAMTVYNGRLIVGGDFIQAADNAPANRIAAWDGATWQAFGSGTNDDVLALATYDGDLIAGGQFTTAGGNAAISWSRWGPDSPSISVQPSNQSICRGGVTSFAVSASGTGTVSYQWRRGQLNLSNGGSISGADTANLVIDPTSLADADSNYNCVVIDSCGAYALSDNASLTVTDTPTADAGGPYSTCLTTAVSLNGSASNSASVSWSSSGTGSFVNGNSVNASYQPSNDDVAAGSITLTLTADPISPCSAPAISNATLTLEQEPTADTGGPNATCESAPIALSGASTHSSGVVWSTSGTGTFVNGNTLSAVYTPSPDDVIAGSVTLTLTASASSPCTGSASSETTLTIQAAPQSDTGGPYFTCGTSPVVLDGSTVSGATSITWSTSGTGEFSDDRSLTSTYVPSEDDVAAGEVWLTLTASPDAPCDTPGISHTTLFIHTEPAVSSQPVGATIGVGSSYTFSVTASGGGLSYQWFKDSVAIDGKTSSTFTIDSAVLADAGNYYCEISNDCGTLQSDAVQLVVNNQASVTLSTSPGCINTNQLVVSVNMTGATTAVVGGQFFFQYDTSVLAFVSITSTAPPFTQPVYQSDDPGLGTLDYAVGVTAGDHGTTANSVMAEITFNILQDRCTPAPSLVTWRSSGPNNAHNKLSDYQGHQVVINTVNLVPKKIDRTPPVIAAPPNTTVQCVTDVPRPAQTLASFVSDGGSISDNCGYPTFSYVGDSELVGGPCGGIITRTYRATDTCGNVTESTQRITVQDTIAPQVTNPAPIAPYYHDQNSAEAAAQASALAAASDNCSASLTATVSTIGTCAATITVTVSDFCGNLTPVQYQTRIDGTAPEITTCASDDAAAADANCQAAVPNFAASVVAQDDCSETNVLVVTQNPIAGTLVGLGVTPITLTVTDEAGNSVSCPANFTVTDQTPPTFDSCPDYIVTNVNESNCTAVVTWIEPSASDNCGNATVVRTSGPPPGSTFANGTVTTIEYTATDGANLSTVCTFAVTVAASPDLNDDQVVDLLDVPLFVDVLLGLDTSPTHIARADANCDGFTNGGDIGYFVELVLNPFVE